MISRPYRYPVCELEREKVPNGTLRLKAAALSTLCSQMIWLSTALTQCFWMKLSASIGTGTAHRIILLAHTGVHTVSCCCVHDGWIFSFVPYEQIFFVQYHITKYTVHSVAGSCTREKFLNFFSVMSWYTVVIMSSSNQELWIHVQYWVVNNLLFNTSADHFP